MDSHVNIKSFFKSEKERTVQKLSAYYNEPDFLLDSVRELMFPILTPDQIFGKKVLLKPNFVKEDVTEEDKICLTTNFNLILATLKAILDCKPHSIIVGDAPVQNCRWDLLIKPEFRAGIESLSNEYSIPIRLIDFRKVVYYPGEHEFGQSRRSDDEYLIFDIADRSWLEPITEEKNKFRVTNYNPDNMALSHGKGMHKYCVAKEIFEADIVITMPKAKTHRMACLTNSLKILVGINGDKDYLPHHRIGAQSHGGDCYKDANIFRTLAEDILDFANRHKGSFISVPLSKIVSLLWRFGKPTKQDFMNAGWYGNDTVWRMVMDLTTVALYGKSDGTLAREPQRVLYTLCDAIIGGQGDGPLHPDPLPAGLLAFSDDSFVMDEIMGNIFSLNISKVPLLREASFINIGKNLEIALDGRKISMSDLRDYRIDAVLAPGWINYDCN